MVKVIIGVIALYRPTENELRNIQNYLHWLDFCILMDDSEENNEFLCKKILTSNQDKYQYVSNKRNIGLCMSANRGIELAISKKAEWILMMNPDSRMENNIIEIFRGYIKRINIENVALLAPQYNYDRHIRKAYQGYKKIRFANMSGSLLNVKVIKKIGIYDRRFFIDGLDVEWCLRALKNGFTLLECGEAILEHHPAETKEVKILGKSIFKYGWDKPERYYYQFRSAYIIFQEYHDFHAMLFSIYKFVKVILLFENKREYLRLFRKAIYDAKHQYYGKLGSS